MSIRYCSVCQATTDWIEKNGSLEICSESATRHLDGSDTSRREKEEGIDEVQIQMAKVASDKELALKELKLQAQAKVNIDATSIPPPPNRDPRSCQLSWMRRMI